MSLPYCYPVSNSDLIKLHHLESHFEGGYFKQTAALSSRSENGKQIQETSGPATYWYQSTTTTSSQSTDATCIYYLLTPDCSRGRMHMNKNTTFHIHHAGRALYTLIAPPVSSDSEPTVRRIVMGSDLSKGEVTQLFVPGGWWKSSEMPEEDLLLLDNADSPYSKERLGCLISEVVVPGWTPEQHQFLTEDKLRAMWGAGDSWKAYVPYLSGPK